MNDITALAEREKFEAWAEKAGELLWGRLKNQRNTSGGYSLQVYTHMWKAWQAASAEMVEALEKALRSNEYLREQSAEWERKAISNFEECAEMSARIEELESQRKLAFTAGNRWADKFREAEKRIASLESRTVTVKLPPRVDSSNVPFTAHTWNCCLDEVEKRLTAAGIQVIEGEA